jgi:hypothetical protein
MKSYETKKQKENKGEKEEKRRTIKTKTNLTKEEKTIKH